MPSTVGETPLLAPSQFAHLKTVAPSTTTSGVAPGQALLDTPSPSRPPSPPLERSKRTRKPSTRAVEASQSDPSALKTKGRQADKTQTKNKNGKKFGKASNAGTTKSITKRRLQADNTGMASDGGRDIHQEDDHSDDNNNSDDSNSNDEEEETFLDQTIVDQLEALLGHSIAHLSNKQIKLLLSGIDETQTSALGTQAEQAPTITKSHAGVGLASRDRDVSLSNEGSGNQQLPPGENGLTTDDNLLALRRRDLNVLDASATSKSVRIADEQIDNATEHDSDSDSDTHHRRRHSTSDSDSDSERQVLSRPTIYSQARPPPPTSRRGPLPSCMHSKSAPGTQLPTSSTRLPSLAQANSKSSRIALKRPFSATSHSPSHLPPTELSEFNALAAWAIQLAQERAQTLGKGASNTTGPQLQQPDHLSATANHIAQAIALQRSQPSRAEEPPAHNMLGVPFNPSYPTAGTSTVVEDGPIANTDSSSESPRKRRRKAKLSDFPGRPGEVASAAIPQFLATVLAEGAYETLETFQDWALDAYRRTWELEFPEYVYEPPPKVLIVIMTRRASWLRGEVKKKIRDIVRFGYGFNKSAETPAVIKANKRLAKRLRANAFHCRDLVADKNHFEAPQLIASIGAGLYSDPDALGIVFLERFEVVPIPAVALILTMMQACIDEWRLGTWNRHDLDADTQQVEYERHLLSLYVYERAAADRLTRYRTEWAKAGLKSSGAILEDDPKVVKSYIDISQVRPDTPTPALENDEGTWSDGNA